MVKVYLRVFYLLFHPPQRSTLFPYTTLFRSVFNFVLLLLVPMLMLVWVSLLPFFQPVTAAAFKLISLNNYRTVLASGQTELLINTLLVAVATATIAVTLTFVGACLAVRRGPGGWI